MILEATDSLTGDIIYTVRSKRNTEHLINVDRAACAIANAISDIANDERMGWTLHPQYFKDLLEGIISASRVKV